MLWWKNLKLQLGTPEARIQALRELAASGKPHAVDILIEALKDRDLQVPLVAAEILGRLRVARAVPALAEALRDREEYIRAAAAQALGKMGDAALTPLLQALQDPNQNVRELAAKALGHLGPAALGPLTELLGRNSTKLMREAAAESLGHVQHDRAVSALVAALGDRELTIREKAARSLVNIGKLAVPELLAAVRHNNAEVRRLALWALERLGTERMSTPYERPVAQGKWKDVCPTSRGLEALSIALNDQCTKTRLTAVLSLVNIGDQRAVPGLVQALNDVDREIWEIAHNTLVKIGPPAVDYLQLALKEGPLQLRERTAYVLGAIEDDQATHALLELMADAEPSLRSAAAEAIVALQRPCTVDALLKLLRDSDPRVRFSALVSLWRTGDPRAVPPLLGLVRDPDQGIRTRAIQALGDLGDESILKPLLDVFREDPSTRLATALAVAKIRAPRAVQPLLAVIAQDAEAAPEAVQILEDVFEVAAKEIAPQDLKAVANLAATPVSHAPKHPLATEVVVRLANDELARRGLITPKANRGTDSHDVASDDHGGDARQLTRLIELLLLHGMHQVEPDTGHAVVISPRGIGLAATKAFSVGTVLTLRPTDAADEVPWTPAEVRHCQRTGKGWRLDCEFVRVPSEGFLACFE